MNDDGTAKRQSFIWPAFGIAAGLTCLLLLFGTFVLSDAALHASWVAFDEMREVTDQSELEDISSQLHGGWGWQSIDGGTRAARWEGRRLFVREEVWRLISTQGMGFVPWGFVFFGLPALVATAVFRRNVRREAIFGALVGVGAQILLWLGDWNWQVGLALGNQLAVGVEGGATVIPAAGFLILIPLTYLAATIVSAELGGAAAERYTGDKRCLSCGAMVPIDPPKTHCPRCDAELGHGGVHWPAAITGVALTVVGFVLMIRLLGGPLNFYHECDRREPTDTCVEVYSEFRQSSAWLAVDPGENEEGVHVRTFFHRWRYIFWTAPVFLVAPLLLAWRLKRNAMATAGLVIPLSWASASIVGGFLLARGVEVAFLWSIQNHIIALLPWAVAGFIGAVIGNKLHGGREFEAFAAEED